MSGARITFYLVLSCVLGALIAFLLRPEGPDCTNVQGHVDIIVNTGVTAFRLKEYPEYIFVASSTLTESNIYVDEVRAAEVGQLVEVCFTGMDYPDPRAVSMVRGRVVSEGPPE